jgi:uncharacterized OsmC-like protein
MTTATESVLDSSPRSNNKEMMQKRHRPLIRQYKQEPAAAWITDGARTADGSLRRHDPVHGELIIGTSQPLSAPLSVHSAVGGDHDGPNPGDYLSAALVGCFDSTMRIIANRLGIVLEELSVAVSAEVDVRGTLRVSPDVPVGFQRMSLTVHARPAPQTSPQAMKMLLAATEQSCIVMQTLRAGVAVELQTAHQPT